MDKDVEKLREEYRELASRLSKTALIGLSLLFVFVNAFSRAYSRVNGDEVKKALSEINELYKITKERPDMSGIFRFFADPSSKADSSETEESSAEPKAAPIPPEQVETAREQQKKLARDIEQKADAWFTIEPSILGTGLEIDVRYWILLLPVLFLLGGSYVYISRTKLSLLRKCLAQCLRESPENGTALDPLLFGSEPGKQTAYLRHPSQFEIFLYGLGILGLIGELIVVGWPFWSALDSGFYLWVSGFLALLTFYAAAYSRNAARGLEAQTAALMGVAPEATFADRAWSKGIDWGRRISRPARLRPRLSLASGSLLTLLSLFLATATSCNSGPRKGYELVLGMHDATWFSAGFLGGYSSQLVGRTVYTASQVVAVLALALVVVRLLRPSFLQKSWWTSGLCRISVTFSLFLLVDLSFVSIFGIDFVADLLRLFCWIVPVFLWYRYTITRRPERRERWRAIQSALLVLYAPALLMGLVTLVDKAKSGLTGLARS